MKTKITVTEALAEIKTIAKRVEKKKEFIITHIARADAVRDPLQNDGGAPTVIRSERQSIVDLWDRLVSIRVAIADANARTSITIGGRTRTVAEWIVWRRDVSKHVQAFLGGLRSCVEQARNEAKKRGSALSETGTGNANDIIVNVSERELLNDIETTELVLGELDGRLSLHNATTHVEV